MNTTNVNASEICEPRMVILLGVPFHDVTMEETLDQMDGLIARRKPAYLATANLDFAAQASRDVELQRILFDAELVLCDGTPLIWASRWLGAPLRERVAGSDLMPHLFRRAAEKGHRLFFLGSTDEVLEIASAKCREQFPGINICGMYSPPYAKLLDIDNGEISRRVMEARPDILLVAMGCPKQEKWIYMNHGELGVPVSIGIGASLDFVAGKFSRAPVWMRVCGLEWVFRLMQEPRRLFNRYLIDLVFFVRALRSQKRLLRHDGTGVARAERPEKSVVQNVVQVSWSGRIDAAAVASGSVETVLPEQDKPDVVIDCSRVTFMDSTGLGLFIKTFRACKQAGGALVVLNPSGPVEKILTIMQLARLIPIAKTPEDVAVHLPPVRQATTEVTHCTANSALELPITGDLTATTMTRWDAVLLEKWEQTPKATILHLDLSRVPFMDTSGLGFLIRAMKLARKRPGGNMALHNPSPNVCNVIKLANMQAVLGVSLP